MKSNNIRAEIADQGDNSPGCSLKSEVGLSYIRSYNGKRVQWAPNIRQYMTAPAACEKDVSKPEPFPSILESAEQERRLDRRSTCDSIACCDALCPVHGEQ
jgi:hypothetical protein